MVTWIVVSVLNSSHRMGHSFKMVNDRARKVVGWICFILSAMSMMRFVFASVEHLVTEALELVILVLFATDAVSFGFFGPAKHALKYLQVELRSLCSGFVPLLKTSRLCAVVSLVLHFFSGAVVSVGVTFSDHLAHIVCDLREPVRSVGDLVWVDFKSLKVALDVLDEL